MIKLENSLLFAASLSLKKVPFDIHVFADGPHGVGMAEDNPTLGMWIKLCEYWLRGVDFI